MSFQRHIIQNAGYDAWISIILSGISIHILIWMMYRILAIADNDIIQVQRFCFGKWIGGILNFIFIFYFLLLSLIVFRVYIEVVQVWIFPLMKTWQISIPFLILIYYSVSSGFRVITGICFWGTVIPFIILFPLIFFALEFAKWDHLLPLFNHSVKDIWLSSKQMFFQYVGFEPLFMFYPFVKNPRKSQKWAHLGLLLITLLYLIVAVISFAFFSQRQLQNTLWPTLNLMKIAQFPLIERVEYIVVSIWLLLILPNVSLKIWSACRGLKKLVKLKQRISLLIILVLFFIIANLLIENSLIVRLGDIYSKFAFYFIYLYIPFLFVFIYVKQKILKRENM